MREKELGLPAEASLERAGQHALRAAKEAGASSTRKPKDQPPTVSPAVLLDAAALVIGETSGLDPEQRADFTGRKRLAMEPTTAAPCPRCVGRHRSRCPVRGVDD